MKDIYVWWFRTSPEDEDTVYVTTYKELIPHVVTYYTSVVANNCWFKPKEKLEIRKKVNKTIKTLAKLTKENEPIDIDVANSILKEVDSVSSFSKVSVSKVNPEDFYRPHCFKNVKIDYEVKDYVAQFEMDCASINCFNREHGYKLRITDNPSLEIKYKLSFQDEEHPKLIKSIALKTGFEDRKRIIQTYPVPKSDNPEDYKAFFLPYICKLQMTLCELEEFVYNVAWKDGEMDKKSLQLKLEFEGFDKKDIKGAGVNSFIHFQNFGTKLIRSNKIKVSAVYNREKIEL